MAGQLYLHRTGSLLLRGGAIALAGAFTPSSAADPPVSGGSEELIASFTLTNSMASATTNEFVYFGLPMSAVALSGGRTIRVSGLDNVQIDNMASDLASANRWVSVGGIRTSAAASATAVGGIYASTSGVATGTAITRADITGLAGASAGLCVIEAFISGVGYSAQAAVALNGVSGFSKTAACFEGAWRSGTCFVEFIASTPLVNGATVHLSGDGLRGNFHVMAWKSGTGAVSAGNPIRGMKIRPMVTNGHRAVSTQIGIASAAIRRATSLSDSTLITTADTDIDGNTITYAYTSAFTQWGGAAWTPVVDVFIGPKPALFSMLGDATTTAGGTARTPTGNQMATYYYGTELYPKYGQPFSGVDHSSFISQLNNTQKTLPLQRYPAELVMGNVYLAEGGSGGRPDIGLNSEWYSRGLIKHDANGRRLIFENSAFMPSRGYHTGGLDYSTNASARRFYRQGDTYPSRFSQTAADPWGWDVSHEAEVAYTAYLLKGDYLYYWLLQSRISDYGNGNGYNGTGQNYTVFGDFSQGGAQMDIYDGDGSTTPNNTLDWSANQMRGTAWQFRSIAQHGLLCPDRMANRNHLSTDKAWTQTWITRHLQRAAAVISANTGPSSTYNRYGVVAPRATNMGAEGLMFAPWMLGYLTHVVCFSKLQGMGNSNTDVFTNWIGDWYTGVFNSTAVAARDFVFDGYWTHCFEDHIANSSNRVMDVSAYYHQRAKERPGDNSPGDNSRWDPGSSLTLNTTTGSINAVFSAGIIGTANQSWYIGKYLKVDSDNGRAKIVTMSADTSRAVLNTALSGGNQSAAPGVAFGTTTYASGLWTLCIPHPADAPADATRGIGFNDGLGQYYYVDVARMATGMLQTVNVCGAAAVYTYLNTWKPSATDLQFDVRP